MKEFLKPEMFQFVYTAAQKSDAPIFDAVCHLLRRNRDTTTATCIVPSTWTVGDILDEVESSIFYCMEIDVSIRGMGCCMDDRAGMDEKPLAVVHGYVGKSEREVILMIGRDENGITLTVDVYDHLSRTNGRHTVGKRRSAKVIYVKHYGRKEK